MDLKERKLIILNTIHFIEDKLIILQYDDYTSKTFTERHEEMAKLRQNLAQAHRVLRLITEEELRYVA